MLELSFGNLALFYKKRSRIDRILLCMGTNAAAQALDKVGLLRPDTDIHRYTAPYKGEAEYRQYDTNCTISVCDVC